MFFLFNWISRMMYGSETMERAERMVQQRRRPRRRR